MPLLLELTPDPLRRAVNRWRFERFQKGRQRERSSIAAFDYYRCIYVHIPKTGGISVNDALWGNPGGVHKSMEEYARIFSASTLQEYFKFTFVRNPWDRLVSAWFFLKAGGHHAADARWAERHLGAYNDFDAFVMNWLTPENARAALHFRPQTDFLKLNGKIAVDFIGKMERFAEDFDYVKHRIGRDDAELPHKNRSKREDYHGYYNEATRKRVATVYAEDIALLDYSFDQ